jgi:hypothetical protein
MRCGRARPPHKTPLPLASFRAQAHELKKLPPRSGKKIVHRKLPPHFVGSVIPRPAHIQGKLRQGIEPLDFRG